MTFTRSQLYFAHGVLLVALFACSASYIADTAVFRFLSLSPLIVGILLGMLYANTLRGVMPAEWAVGISFCAKRVLRLAIILYGFRLTFQQVLGIGLHAAVVDLIVIAGTLLLGVGIGRLLKMDRELSLLTAVGSAICGAAAVLGAESVLNNKPYKTAVAVSTVVLFGTTAMFLYPVMYKAGLFNLSTEQWGLYTGATVHEVAHVVGAGNAMGGEVAATAILVKMIRVLFLAPILLILGFFVAKKNQDTGMQRIVIPWFAVGFLVVIGFNSLVLLPEAVVCGINEADTFLLTMAMTALGMETHFSKFKEAGPRPFILALCLFVWLVSGGYWIRCLPAF